MDTNLGSISLAEFVSAIKKLFFLGMEFDFYLQFNCRVRCLQSWPLWWAPSRHSPSVAHLWTLGSHPAQGDSPPPKS